LKKKLGVASLYSSYNLTQAVTITPITKLYRALVVIYMMVLQPALAAPAQIDASEHYYIRGTELARSGNLDMALQELQKAVKLSPKSPKIHNMLGVVLTQLSRLQEADEAYNLALSLTPDFFPARKNRAVNAFTRGDFQFSTREFEALAKLEPKDFVPHLFLGLLAIEESDFPGACKHLLEARQLSPDNAQVLLALTRVYFILGERQSALEFARQMGNQSRSSDAERFELGVVLAQFEANAEAAGVFQELWQSKPGSYDLGFNLALEKYRSGQLDAALHVIEDLLSRGNQKGELLNLQGWIYNKMRLLDRAKESLQKAITAEPDNADHYLDLSTVLSNEGDSEAAIRFVTEGIQKCVAKDRLQVQIGLLFQKRGDHEEAERWYKEAMQPNLGSRSAYLALANLMLVTNRQKEALEQLAKAIMLLPKDPLLHHMYGAQLLESEQDPTPEQLEKAAPILKKALELNPFYANTHYVLGKLYLKRGDYELAKSCFEKACSFNPDHVRAYYQLSLIARRQGNKEKAAKLGRIVQRLSEKADKNYQEDFMGMVQESLRGTREVVGR
jgi:tetratricopeptide (TPR) repeat protein